MMMMMLAVIVTTEPFRLTGWNRKRIGWFDSEVMSTYDRSVLGCEEFALTIIQQFQENIQIRFDVTSVFYIARATVEW